MPFGLNDADRQAAAALLERLRSQGLRLATAESCTGGLVAALFTAVPGCSDVFERGFVTYSNGAKRDMLGVPASLLARVGAVSEDVAVAMAEGAIRNSHAQIAASVTGIAGPGGGSAEKAVGLVHIAAARTGRQTKHERLDLGDLGRDRIRAETVRRSLSLIASLLD